MAKKAPVVKKATCPVSREEFERNAKPITIEIAGQKEVLTVKEFSTGSFGWYGTGKVVVEVNGTSLKCQLSLNLIVANSKEAK